MDNASNISKYFKGDKMIWAILVILGLFSILAVYSASGYVTFRGGGNTEMYLAKQVTFLGLGFGIAYLAYKFHYLQYGRLAPYLMMIAVPLMAYTTLFGPVINNARRWMVIPIVNQTFQTSDFARIALIIFVARSLAVKQDIIKEWKNAFVPIILPIIMMCGLILPADFSTSMLLFATCFGMMFVGRVSMKFVGLLLVAGVCLFALMFLIGSIFPEYFRIETWVSRVQEFLYGGEQYQIEQSKIAIANGGFLGQGPGNSFQKNHLPYAYADFIYAIICEEYGLVGGIGVLMLYLLLLFRCIRIVTRCPKAFGAILAMGLCLNLVVQAFANIAVSVQLLPVTGLTLPIISMGGTSLIFYCLSIGIILSVSRYVDEAEEQKIALETIEEKEAVAE